MRAVDLLSNGSRPKGHGTHRADDQGNNSYDLELGWISNWDYLSRPNIMRIKGNDF